MKKLLFFLLLLTVAAAVLLYAVPQHLIRQETAAAQADLSLLAAEPETQGKTASTPCGCSPTKPKTTPNAPP